MYLLVRNSKSLFSIKSPIRVFMWKQQVFIEYQSIYNLIRSLKKSLMRLWEVVGGRNLEPIWCFCSFRKRVSAIAPGGAPKFGVRPDAGAGFTFENTALGPISVIR